MPPLGELLDIAPLPAPLTSLVGRFEELETLLGILTDGSTRLLTLTGPGGVGKTRLALKVARDWSGQTGHPAAFVDLARTTEPGNVRPAIATALGMLSHEPLTLGKRLHDSIGDHHLLLLLDNFEHLIDAAQVVVDLLEMCPNAMAIVTSRRPLRYQGEQEFEVQPFPVPVPDQVTSLRDLEDNLAARLFLQRARSRVPNLKVTDASARAIAGICQRLDGLPLALELASARMKLFPPDVLLRRLSSDVDVLTSGTGDLPSRQRTMNDAIRWSHDLLSANERLVFARISLFSGSFSLSYAAEILGQMDAGDEDRLDDVALFEAMYSLVEKSLLVRREAGDGGYRFRMLETIREFGLRRLRESGEFNRMRASLLRFYSRLVVDMEFDLIGADQARLIDLLDGELGTIRIALQASLDLPDPAPNEGLALASSMWRYWLVRGQIDEGADWLRQLLDAARNAPVATRALALNRLGNIELELGRHGNARVHYLASLETYRSIGDESGQADEMNNLALTDLIYGHFDQARAQLEECLAIRRRLGDVLAMPSTLSNLGDIALHDGDCDQAKEYHREALEIRMEQGNNRGIALSLYNLGLIAMCQGAFEHAESLFAEALVSSARIKDSYSEGSVYLGQGRLLIRQGNIAVAMNRLATAIAIFRQIGVQRLVTEAVDFIATVGLERGHAERSVRLMAATQAKRVSARIGFTLRSDAERLAVREAMRTRLEDVRIALLEDEGSRMPIDAAAEDALDLANVIAGEVVSSVRVVAEPGISLIPDHGLTSRELEVLSLLVDGLSDKEIAAQLFISPRTAMTHVANIMAKLGVRKRMHAVNYSVKAGLVAASHLRAD